MPEKVIISGGTGFIGTHLIPYLQKKRYAITVLTTTSNKESAAGVKYLKWNPGADPDPELIAEIAGSNSVINLAGASISKRWSHSYKNELFQSRINSTFTIVSAINSSKEPPTSLINASAVGYYGDRGSETLTEESAPGTDFLARLASSWEDEAAKVNNYITKLIIVRFGAVFGSDGGAFPALYEIFSKGRGAKFGDQENWMPWVHIDDVCRAIVFLMDKAEASGPFNVVSPTPVGKEELQTIVSEELKRPIMRAPKSLVRLVGGEGAVSELYTSENVVPRKLLDMGFVFEHQDVRETVSSLIASLRTT